MIMVPFFWEYVALYNGPILKLADELLLFSSLARTRQKCVLVVGV